MTLHDLKNDFPYPDKPDYDIDLNVYPVWFRRCHADFFNRHIKKDAKLIVELGTWIGSSTKWFCNNTDASVICVDHWQGSAEHYKKFTQKQLDELYDAFALSNWDHRNQITPVRMDSVSGMVKISEYGINNDVDVVYIDASHNYEDVIVDLEMAYALFPNAIIIGDDFRWKNPTQDRRATVYEAVNHVADKRGLMIINHQRRGRFGWVWAVQGKNQNISSIF